ncbi:MAG: hypothetical protein AAGA18_06280 [Verrucomicrobiota bacterium]
MSLILDWLTLSSKVIDSLEEALRSYEPDQVELNAIAWQIAELKKVNEKVKKDGFFDSSYTEAYLIKATSREHLNIQTAILEELGYLFDIAQRAVRLGPSKANDILKIKQSEQGGELNSERLRSSS